MSLILAIDGMGGDRAPDIVVEGMHMALARVKGISFLLFGNKTLLQPLVDRFPGLAAVTSYHHTDEWVTPDMKPTVAMRSLRQSSMRLALEAVRDGAAQGVVSAGNTGAYLLLAKLVLKTLPGIDRPAIVSQMPTLTGESIFLDLGGNVACEARHLVDFALMGDMFARHVFHLDSPKVGLMNVGSEDMKGPEIVQEAAALLRKCPINFCGFVEGDDVTAGKVDVIVTDGFTGNVALKMGEGVVKLVFNALRLGFASSLRAKLAYLLARPVFESLKFQLDPRKYNGAFWLGLRGVAVKSHGGADALGFAYAIQMAADMVGADLNKKMEKELESLERY